MPRPNIPEKVKVREPVEAHPKLGRPTDFKFEYIEMAYKLSLLGLDAKRMANVFDVNESSIYEWRKKHPAFSKAILDGSERADAEVAKSLYKCANGFEHPAVKIFLSKDGDLIYAPYQEYFAPNASAASKWLAARQRRYWKDQVEVTGKDGGPIQQVVANVPITDPIEAARAYQKLMGSE